MKPRCHNTRDGWFTPEHTSTCKDTDCSGCRPCTEQHCDLRGGCTNHVNVNAGIFTCAHCIGKVRNDLTAIVDIYAISLPDEAEVQGVDSEAFNLIGPAADPDQLDARREYTDIERGICEYPPILDRHHPLAVLGRWENRMRAIYGPTTDLFVTVVGSARYLTGLLAGGFPHTSDFERFARDVKRCRDHAEIVLHDSRAPEEGARCPECGKGGPKLQKRYARGDDDRTKAGDNDTWHCTKNANHWWTERDYRNRISGVYVLHASALTATELHDTYGIKPGSIRGWASQGRLAKRGKTPTGLTRYDVDQALTLAGKTRTDGSIGA